MTCRQDTSFIYRAEQISSDYAIAIFSDNIENSLVYKYIQTKLNNSSLVALYFQILVKYKIYPTIYNISKDDGDLRYDKILPILLEVLCNPLSLDWKSQFFYRELGDSDKKRAFPFVRRIAKRTRDFLQIRTKKFCIDSGEKKHGMIAIQYGEGFDINKRSDIFWIEKGEIDPKRVIVFFRGQNNNLIKKGDLKRIKKYGFHWVFLTKGIFDKIDHFWHWKPSGESHSHYTSELKLDNWIYKNSQNLINNVYYWNAFIREFNIKIIFGTSVRSLEAVIQNIAFEVNGIRNGFLCGFQRSELFYPRRALLGSCPKNIFFIWNGIDLEYFKPNLDQIMTSVITGYPYDKIYSNKPNDIAEKAEGLRANGVRVVITLFDNVHGSRTNPITTSMMEEFYEVFLNWLIFEKRIAIIIKSKKKAVLDGLPFIRNLIKRAENTGRCLIFKQAAFPSLASRYSDFAVGIGISTAVTEAVLSGCRGIHCDLTKQYSHRFYQWGKDRIIFDDTHKLIDSLKRYIEDHKKESLLGDWSPYLDKLDPFRDGRSGERIGKYINWSLKGFDEGRSYEETLRYANDLYRDIWGRDKIIEMESGCHESN